MKGMLSPYGNPTGQKVILAAKTPQLHTHRSRMKNCCIFLVGKTKTKPKKGNNNKTPQCWMLGTKMRAVFSQLVKIWETSTVWPVCPEIRVKM